MNRRKGRLISIAAGLLLGLVAMLFWTSEPRYGGRSLTDWAIDAQNYEKLGLTDKPDYLTASNAIYRTSPAAAKTALDWLESEARWERIRSSKWVYPFYPQSWNVELDQRSTAAAMILRLGSEESRLTVEPRLIADVGGGGDRFGDGVGVLTNFSTTAWPKVEPLLLHSNLAVRGYAARLALHWAGDLKVNPEILWQAWSDTNHEPIREILERLLLRHSQETNRLAEAIGTNFLWGSASHLPDGRQAFILTKLGPSGRYYLEAGLTNRFEMIRLTSKQYLKK